MNFCTNCDKQNSADKKFCIYCGTKLFLEDKNAYSVNIEKERGKENRVLTLIVLVIMLAVCGTFIFGLLKGFDAIPIIGNLFKSDDVDSNDAINEVELPDADFINGQSETSEELQLLEEGGTSVIFDELNDVYKAYYDLIMEHISKYGLVNDDHLAMLAAGVRSADLIDLNNNGIPELVITWVEDNISMEIAIYGFDGELIELFRSVSHVTSTGPNEFFIIKGMDGELIIRELLVKTNYSFDQFYRITDEKFKLVFERSTEKEYISESADVVDKHFIDKKEVDEKTFQNSVHEFLGITEIEIIKSIHDGTDNDKIIETLDYLSQNIFEMDNKSHSIVELLDEKENLDYERRMKINRYELIIDDVTWEQSFYRLEFDDGYLANINSAEEMDYIINQIDQEEKQNVVWWIGGYRKSGDYNYYWIDRNSRFSRESINNSSALADRWLIDEPSFYDGDLEERYLNMFYSSRQDGFVLNDVPSDIISLIPSYSGRVGYIVEYED